MQRTAFIALGSNIGDRRANLAAAVAALAALSDIRVVRVANAIETAAADSPSGSPPFLNSAAELSVSFESSALLAALQKIELSLGRERSIPNAPRTIDLDLLLVDCEVLHEPPELIIPHPRMHLRRFVLEPLASIAPNAIHPVLDKTIAQLLADLLVGLD